MGGDRRSPTWEWMAVTAIGILVAVAAYAYTDTQKRIDGKVSKDEFVRAMESFDGRLTSIDTAIREHERRAARRFGGD